jgi:2-polyprenyl-3-methyl-5-hydroxy-6-metoxy-1,4-benzoquinol methylase
MIVLHEAWRTEAQVAEAYAGYAHGQGMFYGKHLRRGDLGLLRNVGGELAAGVRGELSHRVGHSSGPDPRRATLRALPGGIAAGWRSGGPSSSSRLRDGLRRVRPLRSAWLLARAGAQAVRDGPAANRTRVEAEFESPDPWHYATDRREQECLRHQAEVLDRVRAGDRFGATLEVGCAEGVFTETLASRCASVLAVDLSPTAVERARRRADWPEAVTFGTWDLRAAPMPGEFDLIVVAGVLEYLHSPAGLRRAVEKLVGGLAPRGRLFVVSTRVPAAESAWWARWFPRGARINRLVAADHLLRAVVEERADWYVISVFERTGERRSQRRGAAG